MPAGKITIYHCSSCTPLKISGESSCKNIKFCVASEELPNYRNKVKHVQKVEQAISHTEEEEE